MFIRVKYGDDETLLCNPSCAVVNLLKNIKARSGNALQPITIDLTDESGLIQELDKHRHDYATKFLTAPGTYVLVKKQVTVATSGDGNDAVAAAAADDCAQYEYIPLLNNWQQLLPGYRLQPQRLSSGEVAAAAVEKDVRRRKLRQERTKSDSPAGVKPTGAARASSRQQFTVMKDRGAPNGRR